MSNKSPSSQGKNEARRSTAPQSANPSIGAYVIAGLLLAVSAYIIYRMVGQAIARNQAEQPLSGVQSFPPPAAGHQEGALTYEQIPPVGGAHNSAWQNCGAYTEPIRNENGVHTLEHGAVWITYAPELPADEVQQLQTLTRQSTYRLLSPYAGLPSPIVISAWGYQLQLETASDPRLGQFIEAYELNPAGPEPGAPCTNGIGEPQ